MRVYGLNALLVDVYIKGTPSGRSFVLSVRIGSEMLYTAPFETLFFQRFEHFFRLFAADFT